EGGVVKWNVHLEHVISRSQQHLLLASEDHGLKYVDHLRDVGHAYAIGMAREDVQIERGDERVALAVLLFEKALGAARSRRQPRAPLVHHQRNLLLWVVLIHDGAVFAD